MGGQALLFTVACAGRQANGVKASLLSAYKVEGDGIGVASQEKWGGGRMAQVR